MTGTGQEASRAYLALPHHLRVLALWVAGQNFGDK